MEADTKARKAKKAMLKSTHRTKEKEMHVTHIPEEQDSVALRQAKCSKKKQC
jgi:hypothetical protein